MIVPGTFSITWPMVRKVLNAPTSMNFTHMRMIWKKVKKSLVEDISKTWIQVNAHENIFNDHQRASDESEHIYF